MNYLAIDASTEACSVALTFQGEIYSRYELCPQSHSLLLLPMVDEVLKEAGVKLNQLDGLIYGRGPGSFTGVRIGIGVAQGLGYSSKLKLVGVSTLQTMAQLAYLNHGHTQVISAIDARMSEAYCGMYTVDENQIMQAVIPEAVIAPERVNELTKNDRSSADLVGVGSAWAAYPQQLSNIEQITINKEVEFPNAVAMLSIGIKEFEKGNAIDAQHAEPVYLRDTVTWKKLPGRE